MSAGAVLYVQDPGRVVPFYTEVVGLATAEQDDGYTVLACDGFRLVVVPMRAEVARAVEVADPPVVREDTPIKLVLPVASLADARERATSYGGWLGPVAREWEWDGRRVCDGHDPEGNVVQLAEPGPRPSSGG